MPCRFRAVLDKQFSESEARTHRSFVECEMPGTGHELVDQRAEERESRSLVGHGGRKSTVGFAGV